MKTRPIPQVYLIGTLLCLMLGVQILKSQNTPVPIAQAESIKLTGSSIKVEDIVLKSDAIFIGEITKNGIPSTMELGMAGYFDVQVKVLHILQGSVSAQVAINLDVIDSAKEKTPKVGTMYIFFTKRGNDGVAVLKLLPATDANIAKVKALIAALPVGK